jgi:hypothetical protein
VRKILLYFRRIEPFDGQGPLRRADHHNQWLQPRSRTTRPAAVASADVEVAPSFPGIFMRLVALVVFRKMNG